MDNRRATLIKGGMLWMLVFWLLSLGLYAPVFVCLERTWRSQLDYSHGYFVLPFSCYILWVRRHSFVFSVASRRWLLVGCGFLAAGQVTRILGIFSNILWFEGLSLLVFLPGFTAIFLGRDGIRWALPAMGFLFFMIPLPSPVGGQLTGLLQSIATFSSTFALQTLGIPAYSEGNVIILTSGSIGVAEACSGVRMLFTFLALTVGACFVVNRSLSEKSIIAASAIPIAIISNCIRITATGITYELAGARWADFVSHDVSGWLMMPLGFLLLYLFLSVLGRSVQRSPLGPL